jgi:hypothetical protein
MPTNQPFTHSMVTANFEAAKRGDLNPAAALTERLIDAAIAYENTNSYPAFSRDETLRAELFAARAAIEDRIETLEAKGPTLAELHERLSNELDPEIGLPSDYLLRCIHADLEIRGRKNPAFAVTVHHRNIVLSAVAAALRAHPLPSKD